MAVAVAEVISRPRPPAIARTMSASVVERRSSFGFGTASEGGKKLIPKTLALSLIPLESCSNVCDGRRLIDESLHDERPRTCLRNSSDEIPTGPPLSSASRRRSSSRSCSSVKGRESRSSSLRLSHSCSIRSSRCPWRAVWPVVALASSTRHRFRLCGPIVRLPRRRARHSVRIQGELRPPSPHRWGRRVVRLPSRILRRQHGILRWG